VQLGADVEMHMLDHGYVGLCRLSGGRINVCGLYRRLSGENRRPESGWECLRGPEGSLLRERLASAECDPGSFCAVAGLPLDPRRAAQSNECRLGDALTMISPITGNGMSMALEAAELAAPFLAAYSHGQVDWATARACAAKACDSRFVRRLAWGARLHRALFSPAARAALLVAGRSMWVWRTALHLTR
jgi:menaquinone-9 beta-reductase